MNFGWALEQLRSNRQVRRQSWPRARFVMLRFSEELRQHILIVRDESERPPGVRVWQIPQSAVLALDWEVRA